MTNPPPAPAASRAPFWGWLDVLLTLGAILPAFALTAGAILLAVFVLGVKPTPVQSAMPSQFLAYLLWLAAASYSFRLRHKQPFWRSLGFVLPDRPWRFLAYGPVLTLFVGFAGWALQAKEVKMPLIDQLLADPIQRIPFFLFAVSFGPLCEEVFFRGLVLPVAARSFGPVAALALTSVPFALIHGPQYSWSWQHLLLLTVAGLVFGWLRLQSGTAAATLTHCTYNLAMFGGFILNGRNN
jgi:membrane protease YdiL (CAAX protease family)